MKRLILSIFAVMAITLTACNFNTENVTPTVELIEEPIVPLPDQPTQSTPSLMPSPSPTQTEAPEIVVSTHTPTITALPTETLQPSPTPGPWEYVIQPNDTLLFIIQQPPFNYRLGDQAIIDAIVQLNDTIPNANILPPAGTTILIPRPTEAPLPVNVPTTDPNAVAQVNNAGGFTVDSEGVVIVPPDNPNITPPPMRPNKGLPAGSFVGCHIIRENETVAGIIEQYAGMTLEIFSRLNADLNYSGCNFEIPGGGPLCNPTIRADTCVNVVLPTPTPTLSPTPSGSETATPTPTYVAPRVVTPLEGTIVSPGIVTLSWVTVGALREGETYLIQVTDVTAGTTRNFTTDATSYRLPSSLIPGDGQPHTINWNVTVAVQNSEGLYIPVGGGVNRSNSFIWQSR